MTVSPQHAAAGGVPRQKRIAVDLVVGGPSDLVVHRVCRQLIDAVHYVIDACHARDCPLRVFLQAEGVRVAGERRGAAIVGKREKIEDTVLGELHQLRANLLDRRFRIGSVHVTRARVSVRTIAKATVHIDLRVCIASSIAIDCWLACKSHPISLISASFNPSAARVDAAQSTRIDLRPTSL
jgi:hypothetical protein